MMRAHPVIPASALPRVRRWREAARIAACVLLLAAAAGCGRHAVSNVTAPEKADYRRIVSMSPSVTEILFALGAGGRIVGDTTFCTYPAEARRIFKIGGYVDANYEAIFGLKPDLVVVLPEHEDARQRLDSLKLHHLTVDTSSLPEILKSIRALGAVCAASNQADRLVADMQRDMQAVREKVKAAPKRRVLVSIGRNMGTGKIEELYAAGKGTLYDQLLEMLGAENVYHGPITYAEISTEGLLRMDPDVILDLIPDLEEHRNLTAGQVRGEWDSLHDLRAVREKHVNVLGENYVCVPGPRITLLFRDMARAIHPECFEGTP